MREGWCEERPTEAVGGGPVQEVHKKEAAMPTWNHERIGKAEADQERGRQGDRHSVFAKHTEPCQMPGCSRLPAVHARTN